jgi:hypothetical protein
MIMIDTGDTVRHKPTGEKWIVACVRDDQLSWIGWPEGWAELEDCELIKKATPEKRLEWLKDLAAMKADDHRQRYAEYILNKESE